VEAAYVKLLGKQENLVDEFKERVKTKLMQSAFTHR
jgi:hypothetical protein